ncbi:MAG: universal stress protein [Wenzhouxiangellaceae bacterium]|nr:universal stress protein [Wenzhouxiangellaceae bacterium]
MRRILVATDFSSRSEQALRRAALLASASGAKLDLVHAIDPDRPRELVTAEAGLSRDLLDEQRSLLRDRHGINARSHLYEGEPFQGIGKALEELQPDLLVLGAYRRRLLQDTFVGTTAERAIRRSPRPVLMVNAEARDPYTHVLAAVDLSEHSARALRTMATLGLNRDAAVSVAYAFDAPGTGFLTLGTMSKAEIRSYLAEEQALAARELDAFLAKANFGRVQRIVRQIESTDVAAIGAIATELAADLLVIGAGSGHARMLLGSTALELLATSSRDVLIVPRLG